MSRDHEDPEPTSDEILARLEELRSDPAELDRLLAEGSRRAAALGKPVLAGAYDAVGLSR